MSEKVYLVVQKGVYRHDIRGVYTSLDYAIDAAKRAAAEDVDSYHDYEVHETRLDEYVDDVSWVDGHSYQKDWVCDKFDPNPLQRGAPCGRCGKPRKAHK